MAKMLWAIIAIAFLLWLVLFAIGLGGAMIHLLLVVALIALVVNVVTSRRSA
jgi:hypothetical protein